jgi:hypothetical protein
VSQHPYDKWAAIRGEIAETAVECMALIKAIADFIKEVLPDATLTQKVDTSTRKCIVRYEDCPESGNTAATSLNLFCERSCNETQTSPVSTRFAGPPAVASDDDDEDDDAGAVSEGDVRTFARKSFGEIFSPYLSLYVHKRGVLDTEYGLRKEGRKFFYR